MGETEQVSAVVCDAGPLIHLDELAALDLLADFAEVLAPDAVWTEVALHRPEALQREGVRLRRVTMENEPDPAFLVLAQALSLGAGELRAIQLARQSGGAILLTDDAAARLAAETFSLRVHGTLGILLRAARRQLRSAQAILGLLEQLPAKSTLHVRAELLASVVVQFKAAHGLP